MQLQVLLHAELAVERETLRHKANALAGFQVLGIHLFAEQLGTALRSGQQAREDLHGGGLTAAVGAEKAKDLATANGKADLVDGSEIAKAQGQVRGFDGGFCLASGQWRNHQGLMLAGLGALEVGEGCVEFAARGGGGELGRRALSDQLTAIEHQALLELRGLLHISGGHQQGQLRALAAHLLDQLPEAAP